MGKKGIHDGHRDRLKDRYLANGLDSFEPHNVLELLLFYGLPYKDTNDLAHELINRFGSLDKVFEASVDDLCSVNGVGKNVATLIKLIPDLSRYYDMLKNKPRSKFSNPDEIASFVMSRYKYMSEEVFSLLCLDSDNKFLAMTEISRGTVNATEISTRRAVDAALKAKASAVVMVHNHPSGNPTPSVNDLATTRALKDAFSLINVRLIDHIIVTDSEHCSMRAMKQFKSIFD